MAETRTIKIAAFRDEDDKPTCCVLWGKNQCTFLKARKFGQVPVCGATSEDVPLGEDGWLVPVERCPVWSEA